MGAMRIHVAADHAGFELKQAIAQRSDVPADSQRLIYSGALCNNEISM